MRSVIVSLAAAFTIGGVCPAVSADQQIQLEVSGPDGQWVSVAVGYFRDGQLLSRSAKTQRLELSGGRATLTLVSGHSGYAVDVFSATKRPIVVQLRSQDRLLDKTESTGVGRVMVRAGRVTKADKIVAPDFSLNDSQRSIVYAYLRAFLAGKTESVVSSATLANIDWPSLDAYSAVTRQSLGAAKNTKLDGWVTWEGKKNARIYAGPLSFQHGDANLILAVLSDKLVDVIVTSDRLPTQWFTGPTAVEAYAQRGEELLRSMFEGDVQQAHKGFSFRVQKEITVEKLQGVHETLVRQFGDSIDEISLNTSRIDPVKDPNNRNLTLLFNVVTGKGVICEGRVEILLDRAVGTIPRGHLTSFNVREKGPSISDQRKQAIEKVIRSLLKADPKPFAEALHPAAKSLLDSSLVEAEILQWESEFGIVTSDIVWTDWADTPGGRGVEGPVAVSSGLVIARVDFADDRLLGVTLSGNTYSGSTLDQTLPMRGLASHGQRFWTHLFSNQNDQAYALLPAVFQKQLSRQQFDSIASKAAPVAEIGVENVTLKSLRLDARPDRVGHVMMSAFYQIKFKNDSYQGGRCEYHIEDPDTFAIYNFNTEFSDTFPVPFDPYAEFATAITSGDVQNVIQLFHPSDRVEIDPLVLGMLMATIRESLGGLSDTPLKGVAERRYENGSQRTYVSTDLPLKKAKVHVQWSYVYGWLKSFDVESRELVGFAKRIQDTQNYRRRGIELYSRWFENKIPEAINGLMPVLRTEQTAKQFSAQRESLIAQLGPFQTVTFASEKYDEQANVLRQKFDLAFERGIARGSLVIMFDAMHSHIALAKVEVDPPKDDKK